MQKILIWWVCSKPGLNLLYRVGIRPKGATRPIISKRQHSKSKRTVDSIEPTRSIDQKQTLNSTKGDCKDFNPLVSSSILTRPTKKVKHLAQMWARCFLFSDLDVEMSPHRWGNSPDWLSVVLAPQPSGIKLDQT